MMNVVLVRAHFHSPHQNIFIITINISETVQVDTQILLNSTFVLKNFAEVQSGNLELDKSRITGAMKFT